MANIAVLIPHYNALDRLIRSIRSIDEIIEVDLVIVDDGSDVQLKKEDFNFYQSGNVEVINLFENQGIEHALNTGLKAIQQRDYTYIARLDCGDTCIKDRFAKQLDFLNKNQEVELIGTWVNIVDENGKLLYELKHPIEHENISKKMFLNTMFVHPSVCFRANLVEKIGYYPLKYPAAEDYAFFFNIVSKYRTANLPDILLNYELNQQSISTKKRKVQVKSRIKVIKKHFYFGIYPLYGLLRNLILLMVSRKLTTNLKIIIYR